MRDYIIKLNDRNLQRKKASGITNYVMYSLIALIFLKIFDTIPKISSNLNLWAIIELFWYALNFSLAVYFVHISFKTSFSNSSAIRILKYSKESESYFLSIVLVLMLLAPVIPGIITITERIISNKFEFTLIEAPILFVDLFNLILLIAILFKKKKDRFNIFKQTRKDKNNAVSALLLCTSSVIIFSSLLSLFLISDFNKVEKLNLFIIAILIFSILVILEKIIEHYKYDIFARDLENLEYEIFVKDLSDRQIRNVLQKKYMGFLINDYLDLKKEELEKKQAKFKKIEKEITEKKEDLKSLDKKEYPIEFEGRQKEIKSKDSKLKKEKLLFYQENEIELREIINKDAHLQSEELSKLREIVNNIHIKAKELQE